MGGLTEAWLVERDDRTFVELVRWRSREEALAAAERFREVKAAPLVYPEVHEGRCGIHYASESG